MKYKNISKAIHRRAYVLNSALDAYNVLLPVGFSRDKDNMPMFIKLNQRLTNGVVFGQCGMGKSNLVRLMTNGFCDCNSLLTKMVLVSTEESEDDARSILVGVHEEVKSNLQYICDKGYPNIYQYNEDIMSSYGCKKNCIVQMDDLIRQTVVIIDNAGTLISDPESDYYKMVKYMLARSAAVGVFFIFTVQSLREIPSEMHSILNTKVVLKNGNCADCGVPTDVQEPKEFGEALLFSDNKWNAITVPLID